MLKFASDEEFMLLIASLNAEFLLKLSNKVEEEKLLLVVDKAVNLWTFDNRFKEENDFRVTTDPGEESALLLICDKIVFLDVTWGDFLEISFGDDNNFV